MKPTRILSALALSAALLALAGYAGPALAFDPQPDPPQAFWDVVLRIWRWFR